MFGLAASMNNEPRFTIFVLTTTQNGWCHINSKTDGRFHFPIGIQQETVVLIFRPDEIFTGGKKL